MAKLPWSIPNFPKEEGERRHKAIREQMDYRGIDCLIIAGSHGNYGARAANFRYVANYCMWFDDEYILFPLKRDPLLIAWSSGHEDWAKRISWLPITNATAWGAGGRPKLSFVRTMVKTLKEWGYEEGTLGIVDMDTMSAIVYAGLLKDLPKAQFVEAGDLVTQLRMIKSPAELKFLEKAGECADKGVEAIKATAKPGVGDREVWVAMEGAMTLHGAEPPSFGLYVSGPWVDKGLNMPVGPVDRVLEKGDLVLNEITPCYGGLWVQVCRPFSLGKPTDSFKKEFDVHLEMYNKTLELFRPGISLGEISKKMKEIATKNGYDPVSAFSTQHTGFGITDPLSNETVLRPGMTIVDHPYLEFPAPPKKSEFGGHIIGDTYIITEGKPKVVSKAPLELTIL